MLVVMERMGEKKGQKHKDCGHLKLLEPEFLEEMARLHFKMIRKTSGKYGVLSYYFFQKYDNR